MATAARPGLSISELIESVPIPVRPRRDPYAGFDYTRKISPGVVNEDGLGPDWRSVLQTQSDSGLGHYFDDRPDAPYSRMVETEIGRTATDIMGSQMRSLATIGNLAAETLAATMTLDAGTGQINRNFWEDENVRTLVVPGVPERGEPPTVLLLDPNGDHIPRRVT